MRRWLALLIGTVALAVAGTALAMSGELDDRGAEEKAVETVRAAKTKSSLVVEPIEFAPEPKRWDGEYELPEQDPIERKPIDRTAPEIVILHPEDGQVYTTKEAVLEGETEPGAKVFAGDREADVNEEGGWRVVVLLSPGENEIRVKAIDAAGNVGTDTVTVVYKAPKKEQPKEEKPKEEEPKDDKPKEEPVEWEFVAHQAFGECSESPPYDVFYGKGKPGSLIFIESEYGGNTAEVGPDGGWEVKVFFEGAPVGQVFAVHVRDKYEHHKVFEFVHTD